MTSTQTADVHMRDGTTLKVKLLTPATTPKAPLLIAHHGSPGALTHAETESTFAFLTSRLQVLIFDARGSGDSDLHPPYSHEQWVADLDELRIWAGAEKFVLAGGSYGGIIAQEYAVKHPERLLGLILSSTTAHGRATTENVLNVTTSGTDSGVDVERQRRCWTGSLRNDEDYRDAWLEILPLVAGGSSAKSETAEEVSGEREGEESKDAEKGLKFHAETQNAAFGVEIPKYDVRGKLGKLSVPTLILAGKHDVICPVSFNEEIQRGIQNSEFVVFENSGHGISLDEPDRFQKTVWGFLDSLGLSSTNT